ncbi:LCP family protein [Spirillospora sp. NPDC048823]|uniref:LCP family protein n=1 Tax=unclassified Spirillospora TaxID=2642701 RepID=UPI003717869C
MSDNEPGRDDLAGDKAAHTTPGGSPADSPLPESPAADDTPPSDRDTPDPEKGSPQQTDENAFPDGDGESAQELGGDAGASPGSSEEAAIGNSSDRGGSVGGAGNGAGSVDAARAGDAGPEDGDAGPEDGDAGPEGGGKGKRRSRRRKVLRRTALGLAVVMLLGGAGAAWLYRDLMGGIEQKDVSDQLGDDRPVKLNKSLNILLLGSDSREGDNAEYATAGMSGARSDTAILLHLSPNRDQAVGISFPRDSMVKIPECRKEKDGTVPARFGMLNSAFAYAGPTCTWKTLESLTGIHIDHFVQIDFSGFKRMVDALGGVEICVDKPVNDPRAELHLKAGKQTVKGDQALGYVRARYSLGNGSDLERIERQQKFMAAVVEKATDSVLGDPAKTYKFLKAATKSITTDDELDLSAMRKLADGLRGMSAGQVRFVTVPVERYAPDPNRVQWNRERAKPLFEALRHDNDLPAEPVAPVQAKQAPPSPDGVNVTVVAAGGKDALVKRVVKQLGRRGYKVAKKVEKAAAVPESRIVYAGPAEAQASTLARDVPNALLTADAKAPAGGVRLVIGENGLRLSPPPINKIGGGVKAGEDLCD